MSKTPPEETPVALNLRLPPDVKRRLELHAMETGATLSGIVAALVLSNIPAYRIVAPERASR
jgi:predicted DNA-binding protein